MRLLIGFSPGSASDIVARIVAPALGQSLGERVEIESHLGANGAHAAELLARAPADGSALFVATLGTHAIAPVLNARLAYDPLRDFAPVALLAKAPLVVLAANAFDLVSIDDLIALARSAPGELTYGTSAVGGAPHLAAALFGAMAGVEMRHRPYARTGDVYDDLAAGHVALTFNNIMSALPLARAGKARALAVTAPARTAIAPELATVAECALPGYEVVNWLGLVAPAGTPLAIVGKLNAALIDTLAASDVRKRLLDQGMDPAAGTPDAFAAHIRAEIAKWRKVIDANRAAFEEAP